MQNVNTLCVFIWMDVCVCVCAKLLQVCLTLSNPVVQTFSEGSSNLSLS